MKLTAHQEKFCQSIADGMTQADAYRASYKASGMKDETVWNNASKLMQHSEVAARVQELKAALADKALWTRQDAVEALIAEAKGDRAGDRISALKALNEMHGYNAPTKVDINGQVMVRLVFG
jgi:hypothetical protein